MSKAIKQSGTVSSKVVRLERGESFVEFFFRGAEVTMKNSIMQLAGMSAEDAEARIANLKAPSTGWVEVDAA